MTKKSKRHLEKIICTISLSISTALFLINILIEENIFLTLLWLATLMTWLFLLTILILEKKIDGLRS